MRRYNINNILVFVFLVFLHLPFPIAEVLHFQIRSGHLILLVFFYVFLVGFYFFVGVSFWENSITQMVWLLRGMALLIFIITTPRFGITSSDLVSFLGTIGFTFFYEFGYFLTALVSEKNVFRYWSWAGTLSALVSLGLVVRVLLDTGIGGLIYGLDRIRLYIPAWPNYYAIQLMVLFWIAITLGRIVSKRYVWVAVLAAAVLSLTLSRTAYLALGVTVFLASLRRRFSPIVSLVLLTVIVLVAVGGAEFKATSPGNILERTVSSRLARLRIGFEVWMDSPIVGNGLRPLTKTIPVYERNGMLRQMGSMHNDYMDLLVRGGLLYSLLFWTFVCVILWRGWRIKYGEWSWVSDLSYAIIGILIAAVFQNPFKEPMSVSFFWLYAALVARVTVNRRHSYSVQHL